jgi:hypothetical protein
LSFALGNSGDGGMSRFVIKKLPPHWSFVPSKRRLKELLTELVADVRLVELYGTTKYGREASWLVVGFIESRVIEGGWRFYLRLNGSWEETVEPMRAELEAAALAEIERYIRGCVCQPPTEIIKPEQFTLAFRIEPGGVRPRCSVTPFAKPTFHSTPPWWRSESIV